MHELHPVCLWHNSEGRAAQRENDVLGGAEKICSRSAPATFRAYLGPKLPPLGVDDFSGGRIFADRVSDFRAQQLCCSAPGTL